MRLAIVKINGQSASLRTRRRIKENGPLFDVRESNIRNSTRNGEVLLFSQSTKWCGWIPENEIFISFQIDGGQYEVQSW